jgi:hypothetical protein
MQFGPYGSDKVTCVGVCLLSVDPIRHHLQMFAANHDRCLASLSYLIGREETYLPGYAAGELPAALPLFERQVLAMYFDIKESDFIGAFDIA